VFNIGTMASLKYLLTVTLFSLGSPRPDGEIIPDVVYAHGAKELTVVYGDDVVLKEGEKVSPELGNDPVQFPATWP
jgi:hypothetical protein